MSGLSRSSYGSEVAAWKAQEAEAGVFQKLTGYIQWKYVSLHTSLERPTLETLCLQLEHAATRGTKEVAMLFIDAFSQA